MKVEVTLKNGRKLMVKPALAKVLRNRMLVVGESYETTALEAAPSPKASDPPSDDGLENMDAEALHALAKERGLTIHHRAGADKVRAALRGE